MDIKVLIALHKAYQIPEDGIYIPLHVGASGKKDIGLLSDGQSNSRTITRDDQGDNISTKNPYYCELTGLYYGWKNVDADAIGLVHYRRYFSMKSRKYIKKHGAFGSVLTYDEATALLTRADIVVRKKRRYYIESLYSHYAHTLDGTHLDLAKEIINEKYPEYMPELVKVYDQSWGYMFNMAIFHKQLLDEYCTWLFDILQELETKIDVYQLDAFSARLFGRVSEILFNVWITKKQSEGLSVVECNVIDMEPINWTRKILGFLQAKFFGKKYSKSM